MNVIFNSILKTNNLEALLDSIKSNYLHDYYALFISAMAYWNHITLTPEFAAKLYDIIESSKIDNIDVLLDQIYEYIIDNALEGILNEQEH